MAHSATLNRSQGFFINLQKFIPELKPNNGELKFDTVPNFYLDPQNGPWEVGLTRLSYPSSWYNVHENECWVRLVHTVKEKNTGQFISEHTAEAFLKAGFYPRHYDWTSWA